MKIKIIFFMMGMLCSITSLSAQVNKELISNNTHKKWTELIEYGVSSNGKYIWYEISKGGECRVLVISTYDGKTIREFSVKFGTRSFTNDSRKLVFTCGTDSAMIYSIDKDRLECLTKVSDLRFFESESKDYLIYKLGDNALIRDLQSGFVKKINDVRTFTEAPEGTGIVMLKNRELLWLRFPQLDMFPIHPANSMPEFTFDKSGQRLLFKIEDARGTSLYHCLLGKSQAKLIISDKSFNDGSKVLSPFNFSLDGTKIYFNVQKMRVPIANNLNNKMLTTRLDINVSTRMFGYPNGIVTAVIDSKDRKAKILILTDSNQLVHPECIRGNKYLLWKTWRSKNEVHWNEAESTKHYLSSLTTGNEINFLPNDQNPSQHWIQLSPNEKFVIWYDLKSQDIQSYEIATGIVRNISKQIDIPLIRQQGGEIGQWRKFHGHSLRWGVEDRFFLIFDEYDLWKIDPSGSQKPVNLSNGRASSTCFKMPAYLSESKIFNEGQELVLTAMNENTGEKGFWNIVVGDKALPRKRIMEPFHYSECPKFGVGIPEGRLVKAKKANFYLVARQNAENSMNLFSSNDLKTFRHISRLQPEKEYNWMTAELITYPMLEGKTGRGILYKPDNFDANKKYPVIFNYYQERNGELHAFRKPELNGANIDVAWYVSNGYLVFMPDIINDEPGKIAKNTLNSSESAVRYLSKFRWFNSEKIGIQGQSFGGYETNILATNSKLFKAAVSVAANSDLISYAGSLAWGGKLALNFVEVGQPNLGATPWENPALYMENSPVFQIANAQTPLMIVHGRNDREAVPFEQANELYYALRRVQKPVWLLDYLDGDHAIGGFQQETLDFTIRMQQFFDHFLKDKPMPRWMVTGENPGFELTIDSKN